MNRSVDAVIIGGSAGSNEALQAIFSRCKGILSVPVVICQHLHPSLQMASRSHFFFTPAERTKEAEEKEALMAGRVYLAPANYHLLVERDKTFALNVDEPVCYARPSIDVLFESAAEAFGKRLMAILLSGANQDGASGMRKIRDRGGLTIVQSPESSPSAEMPDSVLKLFRPDYVLTPAQIGDLLRDRFTDGATQI